MTLCKEIFPLTASILLFVTLTSDAQLTCDANDPCSAGSLVSVSGHITLSPRTPCKLPLTPSKTNQSASGEIEKLPQKMSEASSNSIYISKHLLAIWKLIKC